MPMQHIVSQMAAAKKARKTASPNPKRVRKPTKRRAKEMRISTAELLTMLRSGSSWAEMEKASGVSKFTLRSRIIEAGEIPLLPRHRIPDAAVRQAAQLRASNTPWSEVERITGHSSWGLRYAIEKRGLR